MPTYVYRCPECLVEQEAFRSIAERDDAPMCHNRRGERVIKPTMVSVFSPYRAVAADKESGSRPMIRSRAEHEAYLRRNGYEEVGNDRSCAPRSAEEIAARRAEQVREQTTYGLNEDTHEAQQERAAA